jgi:hypothetical protein
MRNHPRRVRGQAMVEFLVAAVLALVPLYMGIIAIGKFLDVQHTTDMAARYAAWERTVWYQQDSGKFSTFNAPNTKSAAAIHNELAMRLLNDRSSPTVIRDSDKSSTTLGNGTDPMWRDAANVAYLDDYKQAASSITQEKPAKDIAGAALDAISKINVNGAVDFVPPVPADTLAVAKVSLKDIAKKSNVYQRLWSASPGWKGLDFEATGAILSNTWSANGSEGTRRMVEVTVPTAQPVLNGAITAAKGVIEAWDPTISSIEPGKIAVDEVPGDRLK